MSEKDFIEEVNQDVKEEKLLRFWRQYSTYIYTAIVSILVTVGGYSMYKNYRLNEKIRLSDQYATAIEMLINNQKEEGLAALENVELAASNHTIGYAVMAKLQRAAFFLQSQPKDEKPSSQAIDIYWEIANNTNLPERYRMVGAYLAAFHGLGHTYENVSKEEMIKRLKQIVEADDTYKYLALELLAHYSKLDGNIAEARAYCQKVIHEESEKTGSVVERCRALLMSMPEVNPVAPATIDKKG